VQQNVSRKLYSNAFSVIESPGVFLVQEQDLDGNKVVKEVIFGPGEKMYRYCKV